MNFENSNWDYFLKYIVNPTDQLALRWDAQKAEKYCIGNACSGWVSVEKVMSWAALVLHHKALCRLALWLWDKLSLM